MLKRAFDLVVSLLLIFFIPIIILISFTIACYKGPVFIKALE